MSIEVVTLKGSVESSQELKAIVQTAGAKGDKGDQGLSGDEPQPFAVLSTTIPTAHYWLRASPRLGAGVTIDIATDAKLIVI